MDNTTEACKQKFFDEEPDQGFKVLKRSMQESHCEESGCKRDNVLTILNNLVKALASKGE